MGGSRGAADFGNIEPDDLDHRVQRVYEWLQQLHAGPGLEEWVPRELRHTFVSIMSAGGILVEEIARLAGHQQYPPTGTSYPGMKDTVRRRWIDRHRSELNLSRSSASSCRHPWCRRSGIYRQSWIARPRVWLTSVLSSGTRDTAVTSPELR